MGAVRKVRQPPNRQRALAALDLYIAGNSYAEIGRRLGYRDHSGPHRAISRLLDRRESEGVDMLRKVHGARLTELLRAVWPRATAGDLDAIKTALGVLGDVAKLYGLNMPERVNVGISETDFAAQAAELLAVVGDAPLRELARMPGAARALPVIDGEVVHSEREVYCGEVTDGWSNIGGPGDAYLTGRPPREADADADAPQDAETAPGTSPHPGTESASESASPAESDAGEPDAGEPEPRLPTGTRRIPASEILGRDGVPMRGVEALMRRIDEPPRSRYDPLAG